MPDSKTLYVVDAHHLLYKAHFAFIQRPLINSKGRDLSVSYGFSRMLFGLIKDRTPQYLAMAFDRKAPTFRHELYLQYKLKRPPMPAPIADNIPDIKRIVHALGIPVLEQDGFEADDILASIVERFKGQDFDICLITGDKDMLQLISEHVTVLAAKKGLSDLQVYDRDKVIERYGIPPEKMIDFFAMVGDEVDNVPGISGVGPKTAVKLLQEFGTLDHILQNPGLISSEKLRERIQNNRDFAILSKRLIQLRKDADIPDDIDHFQIKKRDIGTLRQIFQEMEFRSLLDELGPIPSEIEERNYQILTTRDDLMALRQRLREVNEFAFHVEMSSENPNEAKIIGISIALKPLEGYYIPLCHHQSTSSHRIGIQDIKDALLPILIDSRISKIGHNIKRSWIALRHMGMDLKGVTFDTMVASYVVDPGRRKHTLAELAREYLNLHTLSAILDLQQPSDQLTMDIVTTEQTAEHSCESADITFRLFHVLKKHLTSNGLYPLFSDIEIPLIDVLVHIELAGIRLDSSLLNRLSIDIQSQIDSLCEDIFILAGESFNINSTQQLSNILFNKLNYPRQGIKKTKTGYSTAESELMKLALLGGLFRELPMKILEHRSMSKLKSTYLDTLPAMVNPLTDRIHTSFNQTVTETGRLSSSEPNLQNIPVRTPIGREIRRAFIPSEGNLLISADYSQMELRILAHVTNDEALLEAFTHNQDVHSATASKLFGVALDAVTPEQRRRAKMVNFGIDYGMTAFGLSERLGIGVSEAKTYIEKYLDHFKGVRQYIADISERVQQLGYVETLSGRRRFIPLANEKQKQLREMGIRQAINMPIQGTAADIIKIAMIRIYHAIRSNKLKTKMVLQIHDELLFDAPEDEVTAVRDIVKHEMENAMVLKVPLKVEISTGASWAELH